MGHHVSKITFGVKESWYPSLAPLKHVMAKSRSKPTAHNTTASVSQVAEELEHDYGIMETFFQTHGEAIGDAWLKQQLGIRRTFATDVEKRFRTFIKNREMDGKARGVPTFAARINRSRFFGKQRLWGATSFVDSGVYVGSFRAGVED